MICVDGHSHVDSLTWTGLNDNNENVANQAYDGSAILNQSTKGQVPTITTQTDAAENTDPSGYPMTVGTVSEQCFDIVTIADDGVYMTRIGAGVNRAVYVD